MSSGEADTVSVLAQQMNSLDAFTRCQGGSGGCIWNVKLPATRCRNHGGSAGVPQYAESSDGELIDWKYVVVRDDE